MSRLSIAAGALIERIKVNAITREVRDGRPLWIKRRRRSAGPILACANAFFRLADAPILAIRDVSKWQRWEVECFRRLHGDQLQAFADGPRSVAAEEVPGINLTQPLDDGTITPRMAAAAGRELRRAHLLTCAEFGGGWSHGDSHAGNFVYEAGADRARLIDFEVMHRPELPAEVRHADDVLAFLQDMAGRIEPSLWLPYAFAFIEGYGDAAVTARVIQMHPPARVLPRLWWAVRTSWLPADELRQRFTALSRAAAA